MGLFHKLVISLVHENLQNTHSRRKHHVLKIFLTLVGLKLLILLLLLLYLSFTKWAVIG